MTIAPTLHCVCDGAHLVPAFAYEGPPTGETRFALGAQPYRRRYRACARCGHWFGQHDIDLASLYEHDYVDATYGGRDGMRRRFDMIMSLPPEKSDNASRVVRVDEFIRNRIAGIGTRRLLDVGAGLGVFPSAMQRLGWQVLGIEPDPRTAALLEDLGIDAVAEDFLTVTPERFGRFDLVSFNKVLEHIEDPVPMLAHAISLLNDCGTVYVEVPDVAAAEEGPDREEFFIEHHHVFSPQSLTLLADQAKLRVLKQARMREPSGKFTVWGFLVVEAASR